MNPEWTGEDVKRNLDHIMGLDKLVFWPDHRLNKPCAPVEVFDKELLELTDDMWQVMGNAEGIGIAAPQIGVLKDVICISVGEFHLRLANPIWTPLGKQIESREGCLSFPGISIKLKRWDKILLKGNVVANAENRMGEPFEQILEGIPAIVAQHESDHTRGITFVDHLSRMKRDIIRRKIIKENRRNST